MNKRYILVALIVSPVLGILMFVILIGVALTFFEPAREQILLFACENGETETVRIFLDDGVNADARDGWNGSCMFYAAANGHVEIAELLLSRDINIDATYRMDRTALIMAAGAGHADMVEFLMSNHAEVSVRDTDGKTALDHAVARAVAGREKEYDQIIEFLGRMD